MHTYVSFLYLSVLSGFGILALAYMCMVEKRIDSLKFLRVTKKSYGKRDFTNQNW